MFFHHLLLHPACRAEALGLLPPPSTALYLLTLLEIYRRIKICWLTLCLLLLEEIINSCCSSDSQYMDLKNLVKLSFKAAQAQAVAPPCLHIATSPGRTPCRSPPTHTSPAKAGRATRNKSLEWGDWESIHKGLMGEQQCLCSTSGYMDGMVWHGMAWDGMGWHGMGCMGWDGMGQGLLQVTAMLCHVGVVAADIHLFSTTESLAKCKTRSDLQ